MFPLLSIEATPFPAVRVHVGLTVFELNLHMTLPEVPVIVSVPSITNWLSYVIVIVFVIVLPLNIACTTISSLITPTSIVTLPFELIVAYCPPEIIDHSGATILLLYMYVKLNVLPV